MTVRPLLASLCASLDDFLAQPLNTVAVSGASAVAILDANQPVFYVVSPAFWQQMTDLGQVAPGLGLRKPSQPRRQAPAARTDPAFDAQGDGLDEEPGDEDEDDNDENDDNSGHGGDEPRRCRAAGSH